MLLIICLSLLCGFLIRDMEAGKGKGGRSGHIIIQNEVKGQHNLVPIYMPIPIPVPMPVNNGHPEGHKYHPQHRDDGDGEIKKIYLLQPVPKITRPPATKAFPVQTHIHMSSSPARHVADDHHGQRQESEQIRTKHSSYQTDHQGDMKILPIVIIPPIAPMPPISQSQGPQTYGSRMSLTPQFNNYVMASTEPTTTTKIRTYPSHQQDERNFGDYGGSVGGAFYRETFGPRLRPGGARSYGQHRARSQIRRTLRRPTGSRHLDELPEHEEPRGENEEADEHDAMRRHYPQRRGRRLGPAHSVPYNRRPHSMRQASSSIRDIINEHQASVFDDEPDCCQGQGRHRIRPHVSATNMDLVGGETHFPADNELTDLDYPQSRPPYQPPATRFADPPMDRAYPMHEPRIHEQQAAPYGNNHQDSNDEWWFDSIKSVTHVSGPETNATYTIVQQNETNTQLSTTTPRPASGH